MTASNVRQDAAPPVVLDFVTAAGPVQESSVDEWELKASRRALWNLKFLLHGQPMHDLLAEQMEAGDKYFTSLIEASDGKFRECRVDIAVQGLTAEQFVTWFLGAMKMDKRALAERTYPAHPEHYALPLGARLGGVELIGGHIARMFVEIGAVPPDVAGLADPDYPTTIPMTFTLADGTVFCHCLHQLRGTDDGCDILLRVMFPAASPDQMLAEHSEHFTIEFRNWLRAAADDLATT